MENKVMMTFGCAYQAPDVQVTEVVVEHGFQASLGYDEDPGMLDYDKDFDDFAI